MAKTAAFLLKDKYWFRQSSNIIVRRVFSDCPAYLYDTSDCQLNREVRFLIWRTCGRHKHWHKLPFPSQSRVVDELHHRLDLRILYSIPPAVARARYGGPVDA